MDESGVTSADLDQADQDFLTHEVLDEIVEAAAGALNICRMTFGGWPSTTAACLQPGMTAHKSCSWFACRDWR
jgi:hypothetical protein